MENTEKKMEIQFNIEKSPLNQMIADRRKSQDKYIKAGQEYNLNHGQIVMSELLPIAKKVVAAFHKDAGRYYKPFYMQFVKPLHDNYLEDKANKSLKKYEKTPCPDEQMAGQLVAMLASTLSKGSTMANISAQVGNGVMQLFNIPFTDFDLWQDDAAILAHCHLEELIKHEDNEVFVLSFEDNRTKRLLLTEEWEKKVEEAKEHYTANVSTFKPTVVKPPHHVNLHSGDGGYLFTQSALLKDPMRAFVGCRDFHPSILAFTIENNPEWFNEINRLQDTPYEVFGLLLDVIQEARDRDEEEGLSFGGFPKTADVTVAADLAEEEIRIRNEVRAKKYPEKGSLKKTTEKQIHRRHFSTLDSKAKKTQVLLDMAEFYREHGYFYFPLFTDYRGRVYPYANTGLSFQGDEMSKALLVFGEKKPLGKKGEQAMFEALGNCINSIGDKINRKRKAVLARQWFDTQHKNFSRGQFDLFFTDSNLPDDDKFFDTPINALAIVLHLIEYFKDPEYLCGYILHQDARCSGASIIGTSMRDLEIMQKTSVVDWENEDGRLGDLYTEVSKKALQVCEWAGKNGDVLCQDLMEFEKKLFTRKMFKDPVMVTISYGGTEFGMREHTRDEFDWDGYDLTLEHKNTFDAIMLRALREALPSCVRFLETARGVAEAIVDAAKEVKVVNKETGEVEIKEDYCIVFNVPFTDYPLCHREMKTDSTELRFKHKGSRKQLTLIRSTNKINKKKMKTAFPPNLVHCLDAALLTLVESQTDFPLSMVHDSVGTLPCHAEDVVEAYGNAMKMFAESDPMNNIFNKLKTGLSLELTNSLTDTSYECSKHALV